MMSDGKVKWGVIGSGGIARRRTIPEGIMKAAHATLVSVYDTDAAVNQSVASQFGAQACNSIEALLNSGVDAVYVASPAYAHPEQVAMCAKSKKHVLCEKPLGLTVEEAESMTRVCSEEGVLLGTGLMMRFHAQHQEALRMVRDGRLGSLVYGRAQLSCWYPPIEGAWRQDPSTGGGGSLMDMGSHCIDLLGMYFGKIERVSCFINNLVHDYRSEDAAVVSLFFENGAMATVDTCFCIPDDSSKNILEIYGSSGSILARGTIGQGEAGEMTAYLQRDVSDYDAVQARSSSDGLSVRPNPVNMYLAEIEAFSKAVLEGTLPPVSGLAGLESQKILAACYESARTGRIINVNY